MPANINLLKAKSSLSPQFLLIAERLRSASLICLYLVLFSGIIIFSFLLFTGQQFDFLESEKKRLAAQIGQITSKEAQYLAVKQRLDLVDKAIAGSRNLGPALDSLIKAVPLDNLNSLVFENAAGFTATFKINSVDEALEIVAGLVRETEKRTIGNLTLVSFAIAEEGSIQMTLSFLPLF